MTDRSILNEQKVGILLGGCLTDEIESENCLEMM